MNRTSSLLVAYWNSRYTEQVTEGICRVRKIPNLIKFSVEGCDDIAELEESAIFIGKLSKMKICQGESIQSLEKQENKTEVFDETK